MMNLRVGLIFASLLTLACAAQAQVVTTSTVSPPSCQSILQYGGVGNGSTANDNAWTAAMAALPSTGGCIQFPAGKYLFSSAITYTASNSPSSLTIQGDGSDASILYWPSGNGLTIALANAKQTFQLRGLTFATGASPGGAAVAVTATTTSVAALNRVLDVTFRGNDFGGNVGAGSNYWTTAVNVSVANNIAFDNVQFLGSNAGGGEGNGIIVAGNDPTYAFNYLITNTNFVNLATGITIGSFTQGVSVSNSTFSGIIGITDTATTGTNCCLLVSNTQFNDTAGGIVVQGSTPLHSYQISNNLFFVPASTLGINITHDGGGNITGNVFTPSTGAGQAGNFGIGLGDTSATFGSAITGNTFYDLSVGLGFTSTAAKSSVVGNTFTNNTTAISPSTGTGHTITANVGYNPVGVTSGVYAPASDATYTAGFSPETDYITSGTVTAVKVPSGGPSVCTSSPCTISLGPGETMSITYSVAPFNTVSVH